MMKRLWLAGGLILALAGCENNTASYLIDGDSDHSITLLREQNQPFGAVTQRIVVSRIPACQRRVAIAASSREMDTMELYAVAPGLFAAHQGQDWYALGSTRCEVQVFAPADRPAQAPGRLLGQFEQQDGKLVFVAQ